MNQEKHSDAHERRYEEHDPGEHVGSVVERFALENGRVSPRGHECQSQKAGSQPARPSAVGEVEWFGFSFHKFSWLIHELRFGAPDFSRVLSNRAVAGEFAGRGYVQN